jgi:hypothetical protein
MSMPFSLIRIFYHSKRARSTRKAQCNKDIVNQAWHFNDHTSFRDAAKQGCPLHFQLTLFFE